MNDINSLEAFQSLGVATSASNANKSKNELGQEQFLELMIAQVRNQDPFKPLENGEFLSQIAQFSTVSGVQDLQKSFASLAGSLTSNQALQASALVGRSVLVPSNAGALQSGGTVSGSIEVPSTTGQLDLQVFNGGGELVRTISFGARPAGTTAFNWDGVTDAGTPAAPGLYRIEARGLYDNEQVALNTFVSDRVESVTLGRAGEGTVLNLASLGATDFNIVQEIR